MARNKLSTKSIYLKQQSTVIFYTILIYILAIQLYNKQTDRYYVNCLFNSVAPTIDYSHNMRILKLPHSTPIGSLIYRLKGSDADPNTQLVFGVSGIEGRALLDIIPVARTWNEADVYLRSPLEESIYNLTIYVTDGNKTTQVESTVYVTPDEISNTATSNQSMEIGEIFTNNRVNLSSLAQLTTPFVNPRHVFHVPENAKPDEVIGSVTVLESQKSGLPVRFELRGKGSEKFSIKYVFGPKGQSKGEIALAHPVDYEKQNLYNLKILALNAWTNIRFDTRNVATMDIVITVGDVQDTPPVFKNLPHSLKLSNILQVGDLVVKLIAEDGDYADQRPINYALDATSPLSAYFDVDKSSGEVRLIKPMSELSMHATWDSITWLMLTVFASEQPDTSSYDHLWPPMYAKVELPIILVDMINEAPKFIGGWQTSDTRFNTKILHGYLREIESKENPEGNFVRWYTNSSETGSPLLDNLIKSFNGGPSILDLGLGSNGTFELSLEGPDAQLFKIDPSFPVTKQTTFTLVITDENNNLFNETTFDHDTQEERTFYNLDIVARDFGSPQRQSSRVKCMIELIDINDNSPKFESDLYTFSIYENVQIGTLIGQVKARDIDSGEGGQIRYVSMNGVDSSLFRLNQETGQITLDGAAVNGGHVLDRERKSFYLFVVEARDASGMGRSNYTQVMINILDVNDNAPVFLQSHYDAVLLPDGSFYQPLVVKAIDIDEPNSANSQVSYEIIAGNQNDLFSIDTVSGVIYSNIAPSADGGLGENKINPPRIPPILREPITPFKPHENHETSGKILPSAGNHEVEEAAYSSLKKLFSTSPDTTPTPTPISIQYSENNRIGRPNRLVSSFSSTSDEIANSSPTFNTDSNNKSSSSISNLATQAKQQISGRLLPQQVPPVDVEQLPALDLLLNLESSNQEQSSYLATQANHSNVSRSLPTISTAALTSQAFGHAAKVPPVTTLIVRAHDFGIPLRSSSVKVNIYNQALLSRSVSVILNGTAEQLEQRREVIERAFSSITGSKAVIESIDSLSDSSSLSVARVRLAVPLHSLVDLTDLSALMNALDYHEYQHSGAKYPTHYLGSLPNGQAGILSYIPNSGGMIEGSNATSGKSIFTDIHSYALDTNNALEKKLLIYIIIVGICILSLLVIWMIYSCSREGDQVKIIEKPAVNGSYRPRTMDRGDEDDGSTNKTNTAQKTHVKTAQQTNNLSNSAIGNNLAKTNQQQQQQTCRQQSNNDAFLAPVPPTTATSGVQTAPIKADHFSMYNGQVWFESLSPVLANQRSQLNSARSRILSERRASSAPSAGGNSLDSALHSAIGMHNGLIWLDQRAHLPGTSHPMMPRNASGQFFPNTVGYMENLASLTQSNLEDPNKIMVAGGGQDMAYNYSMGQTRFMNRRQRGRKVAPMGGALNGTGQHVGAGLAPANQLHRSSLINQQTAGIKQHPAEEYTNGEHRDDNEDAAGNETNSDYGAHRDGQEGTSKKQQHRSTHHHHHHRRPSKPSYHHRHRHEHRRQSTATDERSLTSHLSSGTESQVLLDSDQELLGFDSTGTPIIATHTRTAAKSLVIDMLDPASGTLNDAAPTSAGSNTAQRNERPPIRKQQKSPSHQLIVGAKPREVTSSDSLKRLVTEDRENDQRSGVTIVKEAASNSDISSRAEQTTSPSSADKQRRLEQPVDGTVGDDNNRSINSENHQSTNASSSSPQRGSETVSKSSVDNNCKTDKLVVASSHLQEQQQKKGENTSNERLSDKHTTKNPEAEDKSGGSRLSSAEARRSEVKKTKSQGDLISELNAHLTNRRQQSADSASPVSSAKTSIVAGGGSTTKSSSTKRNSSDNTAASRVEPQASSSRDQKALKWASSGANSESSSITAPEEGPANNHLRDMKNRELLEKQSIFALTYSGLTTDKLPE